MVCELTPKKVFAKLLRYDVPLDSCLNLVAQYGILDAEAYLEARLGRSNKAVELFKKVGLCYTAHDKKVRVFG